VFLLDFTSYLSFGVDCFLDFFDSDLERVSEYLSFVFFCFGCFFVGLAYFFRNLCGGWSRGFLQFFFCCFPCRSLWKVGCNFRVVFCGGCWRLCSGFFVFWHRLKVFLISMSRSVSFLPRSCWYFLYFFCEFFEFVVVVEVL